MASSSVLHEFQSSPAPSAPIEEAAPAGGGVVALTRDEALVRTLAVLGPEYDIFTVGAEAELAAHLLAQNSGVAILDAGAIHTPIERITERLRSQFPELVLIVTGRIDDQSALATQITNGTVYRFLHKPVSEQRVKLFVDAAWRRHGEEHAGEALTSAARPARQRPGSGTNMLLLGGAVAAALAAFGLWLSWPKPQPRQPQTLPTAGTETPAETASDTVLEDLLARADKAFAGGALVAPAGANAAELYARAQRRDPKAARAAAGLEKVIDRLLSNAEAQLLAQHLQEAQHLTDQARAIKPDHVRVAFLLTQIAKERERATLAQARQAASNGHIEQALSVLDSARREGEHSTLVTEARQELEQKKLDDRVQEYVSRANERLSHGNLVEPAQDNAQFYIESARTLAPNDAEVKQLQRQFLDRLVNEARKALAAGNADLGQHWIQAAAQAGVSEADIAALTQEADRVRTSAKTDALARLALLVNQRLSQGKVLDPNGDSAKFYLAQLIQSDPAHPSTLAARREFAARTLEEAKDAARREDHAGAQRWLTEAREAGVDQASIAAINDDSKTARESDPKSGSASEDGAIVTAAQLELTHYVAPDFPLSARERALSGWVDVQFIVNTDGSVADITVVGAEPAGLFEQPATQAVRKWRYRPILRDGKPINQRARVRVRFALEQ